MIVYIITLYNFSRLGLKLPSAGYFKYPAPMFHYPMIYTYKHYDNLNSFGSLSSRFIHFRLNLLKLLEEVFLLIFSKVFV